PDVLETIARIAAEYGLTVSNVFHAGDGNLHPNISFDGRTPGLRERVEAASAEIMATCIAAGGTITGEHGIGLDKLRYMPLLFDGDSLAAMRAVRRAAPASPDAVALLLGTAREEGWRVRIEGAGTWLPADAPADLALTTRRLDKIPAIEPQDLSATAEAGIGCDLLRQQLADRGT